MPGTAINAINYNDTENKRLVEEALNEIETPQQQAPQQYQQAPQQYQQANGQPMNPQQVQQQQQAPNQDVPF